MRSIAGYVVKGPWQAIGVVVVAALLSLLKPPVSYPLSYLGGAAVALVTLRMGQREGLRVALGSALLVSLLTTILVKNPAAGASYAMTMLLPVWALASSHRRTGSATRSVLLAALLGVALVVAFHIGTGDPAKWWYDLLKQSLQPAMDGLSEAEQTQLDSALQVIARYMTGAMAAALTSSLLACLFLGRWWQALLYNPGGFGDEFRQLSLGRSVSVMALVLLALQFYPQSPVLLQELLILLLVPFAIQGLAVAHALVKQSGAYSGWLIIMYLLLLFMAGPSVIVLAFAGVLDNLIDFRRLLDQGDGAE